MHQKKKNSEDMKVVVGTPCKTKNNVLGNI